jgi:iron complex outermembrane receptor protein
VQNFGSATSTGIELDATWLVSDNITLRSTLAVLNPEYKSGFVDGEVVAACGEFVNTIITVPGCTASVGGNQISRTSDLQYSLSANYDIPGIFGGWDGYVRGDFSFESGKFDTGLNFADQGEINLANFRFGISNERFDIALWVDNVFDEKWNRRVTSVPFTAEGAPNSGVVQYRVYPGDLRTAGVDLRVNF